MTTRNAASCSRSELVCLLIKLSVTLFALLQTGAMAQAQEKAIVVIYGSSKGKSSLGTGFYSSNDGLVVTCYHVIQGAQQLTVFDASPREYKSTANEVTVVSIAPDHDLATLRIRSKNPPPDWLALHPNPDQVAPADKLFAFGHPQGIVNQQFEGKVSQKGFLPSTRINGPKGEAIFNRTINVLPLDITIGKGMSGGPVLLDGKVVGVLSGSLEEATVRTIAWAIPGSYLNDKIFQPVEKAPNKIKWPDLTLMAKGWKSLSEGKTAGAKPSASRWLLFVHDDQKRNWIRIGEYETMAQANGAKLEYEKKGYRTYVTELRDGKYTLPPIVKTP